MQEHEKWLSIAKEDLGMAKIALRPEYFSSATYHCQQCAEKSLKGYLCFKGEPITKTHDLLITLEQCMKFDRDFQKLYQAVKELNPFATKFRYPTEFDIPDLHKAKIAIKHAANILRFVLKKISRAAVGQMEIR